MLVTLSGMMIEVSESHQENALSPMLVTLSGIVTLLPTLNADMILFVFFSYK